MKKALTVALLAAFLAVALLAEEAKEPAVSASADKDAVAGVQSRPKLEPYIDDATGIEFPPTLGSFVKTQVVENANPYYGTVVRYAALDGSCADVYIYSLGQTLNAEALNAHFQGVLKVISKLSSEGGPVKSLSVKSQSDVQLGLRGLIKAKKAAFSFEASIGGKFNSELLLFSFRDKALKVRISAPLDSKIAASDFEEGLARLCETASEQPPPPLIVPVLLDNASPDSSSR